MKEIKESEIRLVLGEGGYGVSTIEKLTAGSHNLVYKVTLEDGTITVLRILRTNGWPEEGKLEWISTQLDKRDIPSAKILLSNRDNPLFPNGFMLQEFIEGDILSNKIPTDISYKEYYRRLGRLMKEIHSITLPKFGHIESGSGQFESLLDYINSDLEFFLERIDPVKDKINLDFTPAVEASRNRLGQVEHLPPVLNHNDLAPDNAMLSKDGELVLIDWDNATSQTWINDYAVMTYWMRYTHTEEEELRKFSDIFLESYEPEISEKIIYEVTEALHFIQHLNLLGYYYFVAEKPDRFRSTVRECRSLVNKLL